MKKLASLVGAVMLPTFTWADVLRVVVQDAPVPWDLVTLGTLGISLVVAVFTIVVLQKVNARNVKKLQETELRYKHVVENSPIVIYALDDNGVFTLSDGKGLEHLGLKPGEVVGQSVFTWAGADAAPELQTHFSKCLREKVQVAFPFHSVLTGAWFDCTFTPILSASGAGEGVIGVGINVTERVKAEEALRQINENLEATVAMRTREMKTTTEELMRTEKLASLDRLTATVAHEINTPVGVAYTAASFIQMRLKDMSCTYVSGCLEEEDFNETLRMMGEGMDVILQNLGTAGDLIKMYRRVSIEAEASALDKVEYPSAHLHLWNELNPLLQGRSITLDVSRVQPMTLAINRVRAGQVFSNIMRNALEHGFKNLSTGTIRFEQHCTPEGFLHFKASNNGSRIPEEAVNLIMEPFYTTNDDGKHSGLGLSIIRNILQENTDLKFFKVYNTPEGVAVEFLCGPKKGGWGLLSS